MDVLVLLTTVVWGANYAVVKAALQQIPPLGFNALRLGLASLLFLGVLAFRPEPAPPAGTPPRRARRPARLFPSARRITTRDWLLIVGLAIVGQFVYQLCFMGGIARTSVANSALIQGCSPVVITLLAAALGQERVGRRTWAALGLSLAGVYLLVGFGAAVSHESVVGDALMMAAVACWASYVVASRPLLERYSPLAVSGYSMAIGAVLYVPFGIPALAALDWRAVAPAAWLGLLYSAVFSLFLAYLVWYTSIQRAGNVRTAMYSNLIPVVALATAVLFRGDRLDAAQAAGACTILAGVVLARLGGGERGTPPAEE